MGLLDSLKGLFSSRPKVDLSTRFERLREAVAGTMSKFYKAKDLSSGQVVGLKILDSKKVDPVEARYKGLGKPSEGEIGSRIEGPNVVRTLEWGVAADGSRYIVQEFVDGKGLHAILASEKPIPPRARLNLIRQAARAIDTVHKAGFVHRDICPRNFVLDPEGRLVLIDFGLSVPDRPAFLQPGNRVGTPDYMAPEIVRRRQADRRIDIFSFGVTAFEICTRQLPWPRGGGGQAAMLHDSPPTDIRLLWEGMPEPLAELIMACLAAEPASRPESMEQVTAALAKVAGKA